MQFHSKAIVEHEEVPLADEGRWERVLDHWQRRALPDAVRERAENACYVVSVAKPGDRSVTARARLDEILGLVEARGDLPVGHEIRRIEVLDPRTLFKRGACASMSERAMQAGAELLVVDAELSPSQMRNLEDAVGMAVCDREGVILDVFARHATTGKARIQTEIAHLQYLRPRIRGLGLEMDQQAGGLMASRGPGETASELMARRLDGRLVELRKAAAKQTRAGEVQRKGRAGCRRIAMVGYTNAGKTTLMNALTHSELPARGQPFETLDTTSRCLNRHGGAVLLSDTVGVIRQLPERLLGSFESTLAVVKEASMIMVVLDASDPELEAQLRTIEDLLDRLEAQNSPRFYVFNKLDRTDRGTSSPRWRELAGRWPYRALAGHDDRATRALKRALLAACRSGRERASLFAAYGADRRLREIHSQCRVLHTRATPTGLRMHVEAEPRVVARLRASQSKRRC